MGRVALHEYAAKGEVNRMIQLINTGCDINARDTVCSISFIQIF